MCVCVYMYKGKVPIFDSFQGKVFNNNELIQKQKNLPWQEAWGEMANFKWESKIRTVQKRVSSHFYCALMQ